MRTKATADPRRIPVNFPEASFSIAPPRGALVLSVMQSRKMLLALRKHDLPHYAEVSGSVVVLLEEHGTTAPHNSVDPRLVANELEPIVTEPLRQAERAGVRDVVQ